MTDRNKGSDPPRFNLSRYCLRNTKRIRFNYHFSPCAVVTDVFPGAGAQAERVQREDDRGGDLRGGEALPEGPAGGGQQALHSVHRPAASEGGGLRTDAGTQVGVHETLRFHRSAPVLMVLMVQAGHSTELLTPLACSRSFLNTHHRWNFSGKNRMVQEWNH